VPTLAELLASPVAAHPEFLAFCGHWESGGVCPLVLADWLQDRGLDGPADRAAWASASGACPASYGDRLTRFALYDSDGTPLGVVARPWLWGGLPADDLARLPRTACACVAGDYAKFPTRPHAYPTFAAAAIALLAAPYGVNS
jgi:hypothetical protein